VPLPELDVQRLRDYCQARVPDRALHQVRVELDLSPGAATIVEVRAPWRKDYGPEWTRRPIARLRYTTKTATWTLYHTDQNQKYHRYPYTPPSAKINLLINEIDRDPTCIFWG
jgi:hypothetical protein